MELCQGVLDGRGTPNERALDVVVPIFMGKEDGKSCGAYWGVELLEHAIKIVETVLERRLQHMMKIKWMRSNLPLRQTKQQ